MEQALPFSQYDRQVRLWRQVANPAPSGRASAEILQMDSVARQVFMAAGNGVILNQDGAVGIFSILLDHVAPGAVDAVDGSVFD